MASQDDQTFLFGDESSSESEKRTSGNTPRGEIHAEDISHKPLAARMRPRNLDEIVGHTNILGEGCLLPKLLRTNQFGSILFYGPPGAGKTTLAEVIARETGSVFKRLNAVLSNVAELRDTLRVARANPKARTLLFIDEIHRFNKAQQDLLLPDVEEGVVRLIGATTQNPGFYIIPPLLSRSHLFKLEPPGVDEVTVVLERALRDKERGLGNKNIEVEEGVLADLALLCDGDLRRALNALETLVLSLDEGEPLSRESVKVFADERQIRYDANEDEHYDTASAFIKSIRGCDPDAALYWLAKMLIGGEDPRFIARRLVIAASEDIGLADPQALPLAMATFQACEVIGVPECELNLAHCVVYMAIAPKSNSTTMAISAAKKSIREEGMQPVPLWLRDAHTKLNKKLGHGEGYRYSHDYADAISGQEYMVKPKQFYAPTPNGREARMAERLDYYRALKAKLQNQE